jgi:hypothetical protein
VVDDGGGFAYRPEPARAARAGGGRGLRIVDALSRTWGVQADRSLIWFELARDASTG